MFIEKSIYKEILINRAMFVNGKRQLEFHANNIGIKNNNLERNDYQKIIKNNLKSFGKWVNSKIADWKLNQSDNYLNNKQE